MPTIRTNTYNLRHCDDNTELRSAAHADDLKLFNNTEIRPRNRLDPLPEDDEENDSDASDRTSVNDGETAAERISDSESDDENEEKILQDKIIRGKRHFRIKWEGFSSKENSWEPE